MKKKIKKVTKLLKDVLDWYDVSDVTMKLFDIKQSYGWKDRIEHLEGGLTCILVAMYSTKKEWEKFEQRQDNERKVNA